MNWPTSQDYNEAIQNSTTAMSDPDLKSGEATLNSMGLPVPRSGNFADVYQFKGADGTMWALKCFTRHVPGLQERYTNIHDYLGQAKLPFTVGFQYLAEGVRIRGQWYPILKMEWVEGFTLNEFVRQNADKPNYLHGLMQMWVKLTGKMRDADIAHADLQHGNVLLVPGNTPSKLGLKLIDYDGMWVPPLAKGHSGEVGHPNFQHPLRLKDRLYNADVDRFPHLVIACALRATLLGGRAFWDKFDNGDNLLFREQDLREPEKAPIFKALWDLNDNVVRTLVGNIVLSSKQPLRKTPWLDDLLLDEDGPRLSPEQESKTVAMLGVAPPKAAVAPAVEEFAAFDVVDDDEEEEGARALPARDEDDEDRERRARRRSKKAGRKKARSSNLPLMIGGGGAVVALLIGAVVLLKGGRKTETTTTEVVQNETPISNPKAMPKKTPHPIVPKDNRNTEPKIEVKKTELVVVPTPFTKWTFEKDASDSIGSMHGKLKNGAVVANGKLILNDKLGCFQSSPLTADITERTLEAWVLLPSLDRFVFPMQIIDEKLVWDGIMFAEQQPKKWYPGSDFRHRSRNLDATQEDAKPGELIQIAIVYAANNSVTMYRNGRIYGAPFSPRGDDWTIRTYRKNVTSIYLGSDNKEAVSGPFEVEEARLYNQALTAEEIAESYRIGVEKGSNKPEEGPSPIRLFVGHTGVVQSALFSPDGKQIVSCGCWPEGDKTLRVWDVQQAREILKIEHPGDAAAAVFSPDGKFIASASYDSNAYLWDATTGKQIRIFKGHKAALNGVAFNADGSRLLTCGGNDKTARVWDTETARELQKFSGHTDEVRQAVFHPDGKHVLSGGRDGLVRMWTLDTATEVKQFKSTGKWADGVAVTGDGRFVAIAGGTVAIFEIASGKMVSECKGHQFSATGVAFADDGKRILSSGYDGTARLWDRDTGKELYRFRDHKEFLWSAVPSPDGKWVLTGGGGGSAGEGKWTKGNDHTLRLWKMPDEKALAEYRPESAPKVNPPPKDTPSKEPPRVEARNIALSAKAPKPLARWTFDKDSSDVIGSMHGEIKNGAVVANGKLIMNEKGAGMSTAPPPKDISERTLEAWITLPNLEGVRIVMQLIDKDPSGKGPWDGIVYAQEQPRKWYPGSEFRDRSKNLNAPEEDAKPDELIQVVLVYAKDNSIAMYRNGKPYDRSYKIPGGVRWDLQKYPKNRSYLQFGGASVDDPSGPFELEEARLYDRALTADQIAESYRAGIESAMKSGEPPAVVEAPKKEKDDPAFSDRRAAEYTLANGGIVHLRGGKGDIEAMAGLPPTFKLDSVLLRGEKLSDEGLAVFKGCNSLKSLTINNGNITDAGLACFKGCTTLESLDLNDSAKITDAGVAIFKYCTTLKKLHLKGTGVSDDGVAIFQNCKNLTDLCLWSTKVGDAGLAHFKDCKKLSLIQLAGTNLTDAGLENFRENLGLTRVELSTTNVTGTGLASFKNCKKLTFLDLSRTQIGDAELAQLKDLKSVQHLVLNLCEKVDDAGLDHLKACRQLKVLSLKETKVTPAGKAALKAALPQCTIE